MYQDNSLSTGGLSFNRYIGVRGSLVHNNKSDFFASPEINLSIKH